MVHPLVALMDVQTAASKVTVTVAVMAAGLDLLLVASLAALMVDQRAVVKVHWMACAMVG